MKKNYISQNRSNKNKITMVIFGKFSRLILHAKYLNEELIQRLITFKKSFESANICNPYTFKEYLCWEMHDLISLYSKIENISKKVFFFYRLDKKNVSQLKNLCFELKKIDESFNYRCEGNIDNSKSISIEECINKLTNLLSKGTLMKTGILRGIWMINMCS